MNNTFLFIIVGLILVDIVLVGYALLQFRKKKYQARVVKFTPEVNRSLLSDELVDSLSAIP